MSKGSPEDHAARERGADGETGENPKSSVKSDLEWSESPLPALIRLSWPIVVSMLSYSVMTLVDTFFVSKLGSSSTTRTRFSGELTLSPRLLVGHLAATPLRRPSRRSVRYGQ